MVKSPSTTVCASPSARAHADGRSVELLRALEAGRLLAEDPGAFARAVATTMAGGAYNGVIYDNVLQWGEPNTMAK